MTRTVEYRSMKLKLLNRFNNLFFNYKASSYWCLWIGSMSAVKEDIVCQVNFSEEFVKETSRPGGLHTLKSFEI
jgi:hypothetical protein